MKYIAVEGCVGAGKTKLLDLLDVDDEGKSGANMNDAGSVRDEQTVRAIMREPVEDWVDMLGDFYADPSKHSLALQMEILRSRIQQLQNKENELSLKPDDIVITERCIDSSSDVFVPMMREGGAELMTSNEEGIYRRWEATVKSLVPRHRLMGVVFIDSSPETCQRRIKMRNRDGESGITLEYSRALRQSYMAWLDTLRARGIPVEVLPSDKDGDFESLREKARASISQMVTPSPDR